MRHSYIKPFSDKKLRQLAQDVEVLTQLCWKVGGKPMPGSTYNGVLIGIHCYGGTCQKCNGQPTSPDFMLHPHETVFKSHGGKVTFENTRYVCNKCHNKYHGIKEA